MDCAKLMASQNRACARKLDPYVGLAQHVVVADQKKFKKTFELGAE